MLLPRSNLHDRFCPVLAEFSSIFRIPELIRSNRGSRHSFFSHQIYYVYPRTLHESVLAATSQLTGADHSTQSDETYGYDANGNRNTSGYTTASNNRTTAGQGFTYTYDDEGNRLTRTETATGKVRSYEWA